MLPTCYCHFLNRAVSLGVGKGVSTADRNGGLFFSGVRRVVVVVVYINNKVLRWSCGGGISPVFSAIAVAVVKFLTRDSRAVFVSADVSSAVDPAGIGLTELSAPLVCGEGIGSSTGIDNASSADRGSAE